MNIAHIVGVGFVGMIIIPILIALYYVLKGRDSNIWQGHYNSSVKVSVLAWLLGCLAWICFSI